jgi:hypothetical protein
MGGTQQQCPTHLAVSTDLASGSQVVMLLTTARNLASGEWARMESYVRRMLTGPKDEGVHGHEARLHRIQRTGAS